jgi:hypothetical protein
MSARVRSIKNPRHTVEERQGSGALGTSAGLPTSGSTLTLVSDRRVRRPVQIGSVQLAVIARILAVV